MRFCSDILRVVTALLFGVTYSLFPPSLAYAELYELSNDAMGNVTGKQGLALDLNLDASINSVSLRDANGYNNSGNNGRIILNTLTFDNGSGGQANLTGMTIDADGNNGVVVGAPDGTFSANLYNACIDNQQDNDCDGRTSGDESFGEIDFGGATFQNAEARISPRNEGIAADIDMNFTANTLTYTDHNGDASGNAGSLQFQNFQIGDRFNSNGVETINNLTFDADGNQGLVIGVGSTNGVDIAADNLLLPSSGSGIGELWLDNTDFNNTELQIEGNGGGLIVDGQFQFEANEFRWTDSDGAGAGSAGHLQLGGGFNGIELHNGSNNPVNFSGLTLDIEGQNWIVADFSSFGNFQLDMDEVQLGTNNAGIGVSVLPSNWQDLIVEFEGNGEGLVGNLEVDLDGNSGGIALTDPDGTASNGNAGTVRLGHGGLEFGEGGDRLTGWTLDADQNRGLVLGLPTGTTIVEFRDIVVGEPGSFGNSMGDLALEQFDFGSGSELAFRGTGDGIEMGILLNNSTFDFTITDGDGWDGGTGSTGEIVARNATVTIDDGSGNPGTVLLNADGSRGMVANLQTATLDFQTDTVFLGSDQGGSPSPVTGNLQMDGTTVDVFSR